MLSTNPYPGTRDFFPEEMSVRTQVFERLYEVVESFGYLRYDAPMLEPFEIYAAKSGNELVNTQIYRLKDRGDRELAIRPEMTPSVARMIAARAGNMQLPARWYSHPNLYRYERKQRGRFREHWQVNVDLFGTESWEAEAEIFEILAEMVFAFGAKTDDFLLRASDRAVVKGVLVGEGGVPEDKLTAVFGVLDAFEKIPVEESKKALAALGIADAQVDRIVSTVSASSEEFLKMAPADVVEKSTVARVFKEGLRTSEKVNFKFDPLIIRGFEYYTSTVFELYDTNPENRRAIAGGGRYDNLTALFGKTRIPGIGFGMGDVTLIDFLETHQIAPKPRIAADVALMAFDESARGAMKEVALDLRQVGLRVVTPMESRKVSKALERAGKEGVRFAVIVGGDELARGNVVLRDMKTSTQKEVARAGVGNAIHAILEAQ
jgi:histidyl-tRNA synthetase